MAEQNVSASFDEPLLFVPAKAQVLISQKAGVFVLGRAGVAGLDTSLAMNLGVPVVDG
ncbi:hypothetical protein ACWPKO_23605 (plasmid) [Coraliomargarita sp. W4R53]